MIWFEEYDDHWGQFYYYNDQTKQSQWELPIDQRYMPYRFSRGTCSIAAGRVVVQEYSEGSNRLRSPSSANNDTPNNVPFKPLPHHSKHKSKPRTRALSKGFTRHATNQEKKMKVATSLVEVTGCSPKEANAALRNSNGILDKAAEIILKPKQARESNKSPSCPDEFFCSICLEMMMDPVLAGDGHTYCRGCIRTWLKKKNTSPKTNEPLKHRTLTPNYALRSMIRSFVQT